MKKSILIISAVVILVSVLFALSVIAETSTEDLPVTESYVLKLFNTLSDKVDALSKNGTGSSSSATASVAFEAISVKKGQSITGCCELILRSGQAAANCPGINGLSDVTAGADIANGKELTAEHLVIIPRDDGRSVKVTTGEAYFLVRGAYRVEG